MSQQNFKKLFTIYFIIFGIIISLFGGFVGYNIQLRSMQSDINIQANEVMFIKKITILKTIMQRMDDIVTTLASNPTMQKFLITNDAATRKELEHIFLAVAGVENQIMQARFLDAHGMEVIRVDRTTEENRPFIVPHSKLQNKYNRDYFQILSKMGTEKIWHSRFNLNIENGKIEVPYRPTIRVAIPIIKNDKFIGTVIVNLLTHQLFEKIRKSSEFENYIIDKDGNYIIHPDDTYSFNKYTGVSRFLTDDFAKDAPKILAHDNSAKNCYIYPLNDIVHNDDRAILVLKPKEQYKDSLIASKFQSTVLVIILSVIASFFMAFYASVHPLKLQKALLSANKKLNRFAKIIDEYVVTATTKKDSTIVDVSSAFLKTSGYEKAELLGKPMNTIRHPQTKRTFFKELWKTILAGKEWSGEIKNLNKSGESYWLEQNIIPTIDERTGEITGFVAVGVDITAKKELEELSSIDKLTGIYNRRKLDEFLSFEIEVAKRHLNPLSLIILDIDHFKKVNDTFGHQSGDLVLSETAKLISNNIRKSDIFGRYGGEEFLIVCPESTKEESFVLAEKLREQLAKYKFKDVGTKTMSLGVAQLDENDDMASLIKKADEALYNAKNTGRNKTVVYDPK